MGYVYLRDGKLWLAYYDAQQRLQHQPTNFIVGQEPAAEAELEKIKSEISHSSGTPAESPQVVTVRAYATEWSRLRVEQGLATAADEFARLRIHALPILGDLHLTDVRPRHIRDLIRSLRAGGKLAPRTIRHVYGALRTMFRDAVVDELISGIPCILKRGELPKRVDKDPKWRASAIFTRDEFVQLISSPRLHPDRRVLYALLGLAGLRFGEAAALKWSSYDESLEPLGRLLIASSWCSNKRKEKTTKTEQPRSVPVHPVLVRVLAEWKQSAWSIMMGREPTSDDLIIPSRRRMHRVRNHSLVRFRKDLDLLGLRWRRQHDLRRTFISLARADGARKDVLERITHGHRGDIVDLYTELPWAVLCDEVAKIKLAIPDDYLPTWPGGRAPQALRRPEAR